MMRKRRPIDDFMRREWICRDCKHAQLIRISGEGCPFVFCKSIHGYADGEVIQCSHYDEGKRHD